MAKPKPFRMRRVKPLSAKEFLRELDRSVAQFESIDTIGKRFKALGLRTIPLLELAWLAASPKGASLILKYLRTLHQLDVLEIEQSAEQIVLRQLAKKRAKKK